VSTFLDLQHVNLMRGDRAVLHDINLQVARGEQIAILGPNGCGKSTLIKTITCELYPLAQDDTRVHIFGKGRWDLTELKRRLGVVSADLPGKPLLKATGYDAILTGFFSSSTLWPHLTITEAMHEKAEAVLKQVDAIPLRNVLFGEMSAGQQRRVMIGRALAGSAECLLLDEPSNALDLLAQSDLRNLMVELAALGTTMLHITHHIADIIPAMKRVICMKDGRIVADGPREELLTESNLRWLFGTAVSLSERDGFYHAW
jgi:iron complex transport system ATP-binding protein